MSLMGVILWSAVAGFTLGVIDAMVSHRAWRWLLGG